MVSNKYKLCRNSCKMRVKCDMKTAGEEFNCRNIKNKNKRNCLENYQPLSVEKILMYSVICQMRLF